MTQITITPRERNLILGSIMVVMLLGALDQTIVSTAMPRIIEQLKGLELYSWVTTAYMLSSTVMVPIYGKLSDLYGRKPIMIIGVIIFLLGSMLCGLAGEFGTLPLLGDGMTQLVVFRAIQGLGGAALFTIAFAVIADIVPIEERSKIQGLFGAVFGLSSVVGPFIGGFLTDHGTMHFLGHEIAGWRWVFYVNLPIGIISLYMLVTHMPLLKMSLEKKPRIDYVGAGLIITTFVPLLLALTWGGHAYPWDSARILSLFGVSLVSLVLFLITESRVKEPIIHLALFRNKVFTMSSITSIVINMAFMGALMFLPLFMQQVLGISATNSGTTMLPLMFGMIFSSIISGTIIARIKKYLPVLIVGNLIMVLGLFLLTTVSVNSTQWDMVWRMVILGLGLGPAQSVFTLAVQNAVKPTEIGVATSASQFFRQIGGTIGVAIFGTVLTNTLTTEVPKHMPSMPGLQGQSFSGFGGEGSAALTGNLDMTAQVKKAFDEQYATIKNALNGDQKAQAAVLADPQTPEQLKTLVSNADRTPAAMKTQVLAQLKTSLDQQAKELAVKLNAGLKEGFAVSIIHLFWAGLYISLLALLLSFFVPQIPLKNRETAVRTVAAD
ncbi:MDR family MFS transporter [Deinococcus cellulosilyticus]|uniref:Major facilitator superfamily (MFS) profile domain-containing protein n=1 Tax=Deinococcus cellulosilyticus (strain DSM 18568 / NBRC 106333 / KACC 11606 / 5516J-15) TaxID=1223518 RepID=A0A511N370_DEIC1|nr:MDR family MFS transporter [Deinococcus cellulosilyticus]GEM47300.1 hypothetical protein DC3_29350 [Deinococcus cellulosilyticus NBRC 106333 = KACC 11606]